MVLPRLRASSAAARRRRKKGFWLRRATAPRALVSRGPEGYYCRAIERLTAYAAVGCAPPSSGERGRVMTSRGAAFVPLLVRCALRARVCTLFWRLGSVLV